MTEATELLCFESVSADVVAMTNDVGGEICQHLTPIAVSVCMWQRSRFLQSVVQRAMYLVSFWQLTVSVSFFSVGIVCDKKNIAIFAFLSGNDVKAHFCCCF